jgi:hypothetical protein
MQLEVIIQALRERCPLFGADSSTRRIAGAAQYKLLAENAQLPVPCAFVIPLDDNPGEPKSANGVWQELADSFAVIVALSNTTDEKGQAAVASVRSVRTQLWAALLGWRPSEDYNGIYYQGGSLLHIDRARLWYQFEFAADMEIQASDGWQQTELAGLPHFDEIDMNFDWIKTATGAPDGTTDSVLRVPKAGVFPTT